MFKSWLEQQLWSITQAARQRWVMVQSTYVQLELMQMPSYFTNARARTHAHTVIQHNSDMQAMCQTEKERERGEGRERESLQSLMINASFSCSRVTHPQSKPAGPKVPNLGLPHQTWFSHAYKEGKLTGLVLQMFSKAEIKRISRSRGRSRKRADGSLRTRLKSSSCKRRWSALSPRIWSLFRWTRTVDQPIHAAQHFRKKNT